MGRTSVPIPIAGPGYLKITPTGIDAQGFKLPTSLLVPIAFGGLLAIVVLGFYLRDTYFPNLSTGVMKGLGVIATMTFIGVLLGGRSLSGKGKEKPLLLSIPWASVDKVSKDPDNDKGLVIKVKKFKPKGTIHFEPEGDLQNAIADLARPAILK